MVSDGKVRGPALPRYVSGASGKVTWNERTRAWWESWRRSPQAIRMMTEPDWDFLLETARIHHQFWEGDVSLAAELRLREAKFGATPEDRARMGVEVGVAGLPDGALTRRGATTGDAIVSEFPNGTDPDRRRRALADAERLQREQALRVSGTGRNSLEED